MEKWLTRQDCLWHVRENSSNPSTHVKGQAQLYTLVTPALRTDRSESQGIKGQPSGYKQELRIE